MSANNRNQPAELINELDEYLNITELFKLTGIYKSNISSCRELLKIIEKVRENVDNSDELFKFLKKKTGTEFIDRFIELRLGYLLLSKFKPRKMVYEYNTKNEKSVDYFLALADKDIRIEITAVNEDAKIESNIGGVEIWKLKHMREFIRDKIGEKKGKFIKGKNNALIMDVSKSKWGFENYSKILEGLSSILIPTSTSSNDIMYPNDYFLDYFEVIDHLVLISTENSLNIESEFKHKVMNPINKKIQPVSWGALFES